MNNLNSDDIEYLSRKTKLSHSQILEFQEILNSREFTIKKLARRFNITVGRTQYLIEKMDEK